jgi:hypothetical protein
MSNKLQLNFDHSYEIFYQNMFEKGDTFKKKGFPFSELLAHLHLKLRKGARKRKKCY